MTMTANGLAKLIEECGELTQVAAKMLAYYAPGTPHPDGAGELQTRLEDEMGDVLAALWFVQEALELSEHDIHVRAQQKRKLFAYWHADPDNNQHSFEKENGNG